MYWSNREKSREHVPGPLDEERRQVPRATPTATTSTPAAATTCSRSAAQYVSPFEVESTLMEHPGVLEAAVIGVPDEHGLTRTKAFVVSKAGATRRQRSPTSSRRSSRRGSRPYKYPREIEFVAELPKTATGKIQRFRLRERSTAVAGVTRRRAAPTGPACRDRRRAASASPSSTGASTAPARRTADRVPARRPRLGRDVEGLPRAALRGRRLRGLVFSRPGYGRSTPRPHDVRWGADFMHRQADRRAAAVVRGARRRRRADRPGCSATATAARSR